MSELDADLYGDLYGTEDLGPDPTIKPEPQDNSLTVEPVSSTPTAEPDVKSGSATLSKITALTSPAPIASWSEPASNIQRHVPPPAPNVPQQIPTYQESNNDDRSPGRGNYHNVAVEERSVRPSEMKDEGCFAFLTFDDPASVNAVMVREHFLDGKIIDPKRAIPRQEHQRATKLFIGGLAGSVTSESMREFFSQFGKVVDSTVMLDRETGRSKGFGFVSFEDTDVTPFLGFGNLEIDGKLIDVKLAQPRSQRDQFDNSGGGVAGAGAGAGAGTGAGAGAGRGAGFNNPAYNQNAAMPNMQSMSGNTPFDAQALAALYTRMFAQMGGMAAMNGMNAGAMMGGGNMGPMMSGGAPGMMGNGPMGRGMGSMSSDPRVGMGRGGPPTGPAAAGPGPNVPRGPRAAQGQPPLGPQRAGHRGQHSFHPYAR
ncbi:heterogeneous nuclear ribonucleoprotein HRP1 [Lactarius akahatsu]|uniref:Heterogeneous nuclear ribonucleoprotein HRP1 n=1 Tax=Lactarius akahatsu TaxID=416441 RepID=A0AAD4QC70_9AGAM|nr:heterogeneous nuclear ribonucleoprotein HRP1 [Lactarius akahatsu]